VLIKTFGGRQALLATVLAVLYVALTLTFLWW
jgi:hypothetical protein